MKVRRATPADVDTVVALRIALLGEYGDHPVYGQLRPDAAERARPSFAAQLESSSEAIFLAEEHGSAVGIIRCVESIGSPLLFPDRYCYVSSAYVRPSHRRRGVLRAMFERALDWCRERGLSEMRLHNVDTSRSAVECWEALGFEVVEQVRMLKLRDAAQSASRAESASPASVLPPSSSLI